MTERPVNWAQELLDEIEADPTGISFLDIEELLKAWNVTEPLPGQDAVGYRCRVNPDLPDFIFYYPLKSELAPATVRSICSAIRELARRLAR